MSDPLVSILVPCHNAAPWLEAALRSALEQTWSRVEIIVIDDGSTDGSDRIAPRFASGRCQVVLQEKRGASTARNRAYGLAQGDLIQYLDADDLLAPDKIERQVRALIPHEIGTLSFGSVVYFFDSIVTGEKRLHAARLPAASIPPEEFLTDLWNGKGSVGMIQTSQWLVPRSLIEKAGPWNEQLSVDDDGEFFARVVLAASRLKAVPDACVYYRKFRDGKNLSARALTQRAGQQSALLAAKLKSTHLLQRTSAEPARRAAERLLTREIVSAYPAFPELTEEGFHFLAEHSLNLATPLEGSPWFLRLYPWIGWKAARRLQTLTRTRMSP